MSEPGGATVADDGRTVRLVLFSARGADLTAVELSAEAAVRLAGKLIEAAARRMREGS